MLRIRRMIALLENTRGRSRRIRIWAALVLGVVLLCTFQAAYPSWRVIPDFSGLEPIALLGLLLVAMTCEYVDSSLGMGYGTTLTPLLLLMGFEPLSIVPCVLLSEFLTGLTAAAMHHRDGNVDFLRDRQTRRTVLFLSILSVVGTLAAVTLALSVPKLWLTGIIAVIVLSVGVITLATAGRRLRYRAGHLIGIGAVAAFNKGLSGGGYGPLVTAGQVVSGVSPKNAVAITSLTESLTCLVGLAAYLAIGGPVNWSLAPPLTIGAMLSVPVATLTVRALPEKAMRVGVGVFTCSLGVMAFVKLLW